jgi:hypothetical protein
MAFEHKPDSGSVFPNDRKTQDTHPDWRGDALIGGKLYWISLWLNEGQGGRPRWSLRFTPKDATQPTRASVPAETRPSPPPPIESSPQQKEFDDDDIPF